MSKDDDDLRPSWVPEEPNPEFACSVVRGIDSAVNSVTGAKEYPDAVHLRKVPLRKKNVYRRIRRRGGEGGSHDPLQSHHPYRKVMLPRILTRHSACSRLFCPARAMRSVSGSPVCARGRQSSFIESFGTMLCQQATKWRRWQSTRQAPLPADPS